MEKNEKNLNEVVSSVEVKEVEFLGFKLRFSNEIAKRIFELADEDVEKFSSVNYASVKSVYNKKTRSWRFLLTVHLLANKIMDTINLNLQKMNIICRSHNVEFDPLRELPETRIDCKIRFVHGITSSNSLNPNAPYIACQLFPVAKNDLGISRNTFYENLWILKERLAEFQIYKMIDKITFKTASKDEIEPIANIEDINY